MYRQLSKLNLIVRKGASSNKRTYSSSGKNYSSNSSSNGSSTSDNGPWGWSTAMKVKSYLTSTVIDVLTFISIFHCFCTYVGNVTYCVGPSMIPTFKEEGDFVVVDTFSHRFNGRKFGVGDIIIATCPYDTDKDVCKRIAAVEGDPVPMINSTYYASNNIPVEIIPKGHVWLAGDNPGNSTDSRNYGAVPVGLIKGRAVYKLLSHQIDYLPKEAPVHDESSHADQRQQKNTVTVSSNDNNKSANK